MFVFFLQKGLVSVVMATHIQPRLSKNLDTVIIYKHKQIIKEIQSIDEKSILSEIIDMLPEIKHIGLEELKVINLHFF